MKYAITIVINTTNNLPSPPDKHPFYSDYTTVVAKDMIRTSIPNTGEVIRYNNTLYQVLTVIHEFEDRVRHVIDDKITLICSKLSM